MSVFKIEIKEERILHEETILTATVKNGNWRAWENWQDTAEETPLTINTIREFSYVSDPVKFVFPHYEVIEGELIENGTETRLYSSLIEFLSVAMGWAKDSIRDTREYKAILCDFAGRYSAITEENNLIFENDATVTVTIKREE